MTVADLEKGLACILAWREERSNQVNGMTAVLFVVRNRAKAGWGQGSWTNVIEAHNQFSSISRIGDSQTVVYPDVRDPKFLALLQVVDTVYDDSRPDNLTGGALYYCDPGPGITPGGWFEKNISGKPSEHPIVAKIGTTLYYK